MMPMPPTTSDIEAIAARKMVRMDVILPRNDKISCLSLDGKVIF